MGLDEGGRVTAAGAYAKAEGAYNQAEKAMAEVSAHERECVLRYQQINANIDTINKSLKWVGGIAVSAIVALSIWGFEQWATASSSKSKALDEQFASLNRRLNDLDKRPSVVVAPASPAAVPLQPSSLDPYTGTADATPGRP